MMDASFGPEVRPADLLVPDPPTRLTGATDLLCIAVAIYHEARDQALDGQLAVASVILNRTKEPDRWGATPCAVVVPVQFSFMRDDGSYPAIPKDETWAIAVEMAREALERGPSALVGRADHYHTLAVDPTWNNTMDQVVKIEDHIFFAEAEVRG
jgi:spore germination cell wall hydrolase CwlJ-like protein